MGRVEGTYKPDKCQEKELAPSTCRHLLHPSLLYQVEEARGVLVRISRLLVTDILQGAQEENRRDHLVVGSLVLGPHGVPEHADGAAVVLVRLDLEPLAAEPVVRRHLGDA